MCKKYVEDQPHEIAKETQEREALQRQSEVVSESPHPFHRFTTYEVSTKKYSTFESFVQKENSSDIIEDEDEDAANEQTVLGLFHRKSAIVRFFRSIYSLLDVFQIWDLIEYIRNYPPKATLQSKYRYTSLAILNNSVNLEKAIKKSLQYNIPLMHIVIDPTNSKEEQIVKSCILDNFMVSHFINQNFVLYGDWNLTGFYKQFSNQQQKIPQNKIPEEQTLWKQKTGRIVFRKGGLVFAEINLLSIQAVDEHQLQEKLQEVRDYYYKVKHFDLVFGTSQKEPSPMVREQLSGQERERERQQISESIKSKGSQEILNEYLDENVQNSSPPVSERFSMQQKESSDQLQEEGYFKGKGVPIGTSFLTPPSKSKIYRKRFDYSPESSFQTVKAQQQQQKADLNSDLKIQSEMQNASQSSVPRSMKKSHKSADIQIE